MKWLKVHQVHEYSYTCLQNGVQEVELAYHGGINTHNIKTHETFKTSDNKYNSWIADSNFDPLQWEMKGIHICRPEKLSLTTAKPAAVTGRKCTNTFASGSAYQKDLVQYAHAWACVDYAEDSVRVRTAFKQPEDIKTTNIVIVTKGWAQKKQPPPVRIAPEIKDELAVLFNCQKPRISPDQALVILKGKCAYRNSVYVDYVLTEARIKSYYSQLLKMKKDQGLNATAPVVVWQHYKSLSTLHALRFEIHRRKLQEDVNGKTKKQLIEILRNDDKHVEEGHPEDDDIMMAYATQLNAPGNLDADQASEDDSSNRDALGNLDDADNLVNLMNECEV
jgi:hypothetical protein